MKVIRWSYYIYDLAKTGGEELFPVLGIGEAWGGTDNTIQTAIAWSLTISMAFEESSTFGKSKASEIVEKG